MCVTQGPGSSTYRGFHGFTAVTEQGVNRVVAEVRWRTDARVLSIFWPFALALRPGHSGKTPTATVLGGPAHRGGNRHRHIR